MPVPVNVENFVRAESDRTFASIQADAGGVNRVNHNRGPVPIEHQPVIRMNRDTLYSAAVVDISEGATVTVPDGGNRYVSVMVVNQDHYINRTTSTRFGTCLEPLPDGAVSPTTKRVTSASSRASPSASTS